MTEQEIKKNSSDELKEKYPIGKRFVNEKGEVFMVITYCHGDIYFVKYIENPLVEYCYYSYQECEEKFKPYTEPKTKTVYVHWDGGERFITSTVASKFLLKNSVTIKKVTLTEGGFDES